MKIDCRKNIQFYENELQPAFFQVGVLSESTNLDTLIARFARQRVGMMRPVARSDISANEVSHSLFSKSISIEIHSGEF